MKQSTSSSIKNISQKTHKKINSTNFKVDYKFSLNKFNLKSSDTQIDKQPFLEKLEKVFQNTICFPNSRGINSRVSHINKNTVWAGKAKQQIFTGETFPIIIYDVRNSNKAFNIAKKWGATHVHRYGMGISVDKDQSFFDRAADHDLKVMSNLRLKRWIDMDGGIDSMRAYVQHFKDHPALGFWYLSDEPDNKGYPPAELTPFYDMVRKERPAAPVAVAHARSENWYRYGEVQDVLMYDSYPIQGEIFPKVRLNEWTYFTKKAIKRGKKDGDIVVPILQIFNWKAMAEKGQKKFRGFDVEKLRYPNKQELRYMSFVSIALGAEGLSFYSYYRSRMVDKGWAEHILAPVIHEAKTFMMQVADAHRQPVLQGENEDFFLTLWTSEEDTFVILVNASPKSLQVQQSLEGALEEGRLESWGNTRKAKATLKDGSISVRQIRPWEVLIWRTL